MAFSLRVKHASVVSAAAVAIGLLGCGSQVSKRSPAEAGDTDDEPGSLAAPKPTPTASPTAAPSSSEDSDVALDPVPITGVNLTYEGARARCDVVKRQTATYRIDCAAVVIREGDEVKATAIPEGLEVVWALPSAGSDVTSLDCTKPSQHLTYACDVMLASATKPVSLQFDLRVSEPARDMTRVESAVVELPFMVGVAAGLVPSIPFSYVRSAQPSDPAAGTPKNSAVRLGFQPQRLGRAEVAFAGVTSTCERKDDLLFSHGKTIFRLAGDVITVFAGAPSWEISAGESRELLMIQVLLGAADVALAVPPPQGGNRATFGPYLTLACRPDGVVVADALGHRVVEVLDSGATRVLAGTGTGGDSPDGAVAATTAINKPTGVAIDRKGLVYFSEERGRKIRRIDAKGRLETIVERTESSTPLGRPHGLAFLPSGELVFVDIEHNAVRKREHGGSIVRLAGNDARDDAVAPPGSAAASSPVSRPSQVLVDREGRVVFNELFRGIRRIESNGSSTALLAAEGPAELLPGLLLNPGKLPALARHDSFLGLALLSDGALGFSSGSGVERLEMDGRRLPVVGAAARPTAGCDAPDRADAVRLHQPSALAIDARGRILVADRNGIASEDVVVRRIEERATGEPQVVTVAGCAGPDARMKADVFSIAGVPGFEHTFLLGGAAMRKDGALLFANPKTHYVVAVADGAITVVAGTGLPVGLPGSLAAPIDVSVGPRGEVYVAELVGQKISLLGPAGPLAVATGLTPVSIAATSDGALFAVDVDGLIWRMVPGVEAPAVVAGVPKGAQPSAPHRADLALERPVNLRALGNDDLLFVEAGPGLVRRLRRGVDGVWSVETFFGGTPRKSCASGREQGLAAAGAVDDAVRSSLAVVCQGEPYAVAVRDGCAVGEGFLKIAVAQGFVEYANVVEIVRACPGA